MIFFLIFSIFLKQKKHSIFLFKRRNSRHGDISKLGLAAVVNEKSKEEKNANFQKQKYFMTHFLFTGAIGCIS